VDCSFNHPSDNLQQALEKSKPDKLMLNNLSTAIISAIALSNLTQIYYYYPNTIELNEAKELHKKLAEQLKSSITDCKLDHVIEFYNQLNLDSLESTNQWC